MRRLARFFELLKDTGARWSDDHCYRLGAAVAFFALFSIFPLLLLLVTILGFFLGNDASVRQSLVEYVARASSPAFHSLLDETLASMQSHETARGIGAVVGFVTIVFGASGVFSELESTLNMIWRVEVLPANGVWRVILQAIKEKATSFAIVAGTAFVLIGSLVFSTALKLSDASFPGSVAHVLAWDAGETILSMGFLTLLFSSMFRMLPQTPVAWSDVFGGALLTAVLFTILKRLFALYLSRAGGYAAYGATGAILGLLMWIFLASLCLFFGAEFTRVYAERYGSLKGAVRGP